jgi:hypothetical protein
LSKAAQKRFRKELGKMLGAGRYWEWLEALEKGSVVAEYRREWQEAWQSLARRGLRDPQHMEEFLARSGALRQRPDLSEIQFLFLLKEFIEKDEGGEKLASLKGLNFPAEAVRKQAMSWSGELFPEEKLRKSLSTLLSRPGEVTKKNYEGISWLLEGTAVALPIRSLGGQVATLRSLAKRPSFVDSLDELSDVEFALKEAAGSLSPHLQRVLFYPFLFHTSQIVQPLLETREEASIAKVVSSIPYLFGLLAGDRAGEIKRQLSPLIQGLPDGVVLEEVIHGSDLDKKIGLLGRMRSFRPKGDKGDEYLEDFLDLYKSILSDIQKMRQSLSEKERKDLERVMGTVLAKDVQLLWDGTATEHDLVGILFSAGQSACLDRRLSILSLLLAEKQGHWRLKTLAEGFLKGQTCPTREDIFWLFEEFSETLFPRVNSLRPLLGLWGGDAPFLRDLARELWAKAMPALFFNSLSKKLDRFFPFAASGPQADEVKRSIQIFRKDLNGLRSFRPLGEVAEFLDCFPDDYFTESGYHRLLGIMLERRGFDSVIEMMESVVRSSASMGGIGSFPMNPLRDYFGIQERVFYSFLRENWKELKTTSLQGIERLIGILLRKETLPEDRNLLPRIGNLLDERLWNGEKEAGLIKEKLMGELARKTHRPRKSPPRKGRRRPKSLW